MVFFPCEYKCSSHRIYYCESFKESKFHVKYANTEKLTTYFIIVFKSNQIFGTKHWKTNQL